MDRGLSIECNFFFGWGVDWCFCFIGWYGVLWGRFFVFLIIDYKGTILVIFRNQVIYCDFFFVFIWFFGEKLYDLKIKIYIIEWFFSIVWKNCNYVNINVNLLQLYVILDIFIVKFTFY